MKYLLPFFQMDKKEVRDAHRFRC